MKSVKQIAQSFLFILSILFTSCEDEVKNIKLPENTGEKLVVTSYISPEEETIVVIVSNSKEVFGKDQNKPIKRISDATVIISDGVNSASLPFNVANNYYSISQSLFKIEGGKTYTLKVISSDNKQVKATCTVPLNVVSFSEIQILKNTQTDPNSNYSRSATIEWQDVPTVPNFFVIQGAKVENNNNNYNNVLHIDPAKAFVSDASRDGRKIIVSNIEMYDYYSPNGVDSANYEFSLINADYNYYQHNKNIATNTGFDIFGEPMNIYSNIEGGLGIFGAFRVSRKQVSF